MYAVVQIGSDQFKVSEGDIISPKRLDSEKGKDLTLDKVLVYSNGEDVRVGQPYLSDVKVTAKITQHYLDEKLVAFKYRRTKDSASKKGHRQQLTSLKITKIAA